MTRSGEEDYPRRLAVVGLLAGLVRPSDLPKVKFAGALERSPGEIGLVYFLDHKPHPFQQHPPFSRVGAVLQIPRQGVELLPERVELAGAFHEVNRNIMNQPTGPYGGNCTRRTGPGNRPSRRQ